MGDNVAFELGMRSLADGDIGRNRLGEIFAGDRIHPVLGMGLQSVAGVHLVA